MGRVGVITSSKKLNFIMSSGGTSDLNSFTTSDLTEGSNLYFTDERVDDRVAALIQGSAGISWDYNDTNGTLTPILNISGTSLIELYVTGGTYSNGTATFTNTTGGTFNVTGFYNGATVVTITTSTYNATFLNGRNILLADTDTAGSTITINLPTAVSNYASYTIKKIGVNNQVIVDALGGQTINGDLTQTILFKNTVFTIESNGTAWEITG